MYFCPQSQNSKFQIMQYSLDYKGVDHTSTLVFANPNLLTGTGIEKYQLFL